MLFSIICSFQIFWKNKNDNFDIKINTREQEIKKKRKKRKGESEREGEEEREDKWWEEREKQWGPVIQSMVQLQLDIKSVFSVCESSKNHQSLRFGDWRLGSISNHFPKTFQGLPNIYLFWINVINPPPPFPGVTQKKRVTVKRLQVLCFSYKQPGRPSTVARRFHISRIIFLL